MSIKDCSNIEECLGYLSTEFIGDMPTTKLKEVAERIKEITIQEKQIASTELDRLDALLKTAWGIIANAGGGDWKKETTDWQEAAVRWRDDYHKKVKEGGK